MGLKRGRANDAGSRTREFDAAQGDVAAGGPSAPVRGSAAPRAGQVAVPGAPGPSRQQGVGSCGDNGGVTAETVRVWALQGASNFRDLGGYVGAGGRPLRWRRLFRSDHLAGLSAADHEMLRPLGLDRALDFRGRTERSAALYELPGAAVHSLAIEPMVAERLQALAAAGHAPTAELAVKVMKELYRAFVDEQAPRFTEFFDHLLGADGPVVFHCTAGKDRTGFAAALLLLALGVPRDVVMQDYLLSNEVFKPPPVPQDDPRRDAIAVMWRVEEAFLAEALRAVDEDHGGVERYLADRIGLCPSGRAMLRARYLEGDAAPAARPAGATVGANVGACRADV